MVNINLNELWQLTRVPSHFGYDDLLIQKNGDKGGNTEIYFIDENVKRSAFHENVDESESFTIYMP